MRNSNSPPSYGQQPDSQAVVKGIANNARRPSMLQRGLDPADVRNSAGNLSGARIGNVVRNAADPLGIDPLKLFGSGGPKKVKGQIDPTTGTVTVGNYGKNNQALSDAFTNYLRTGDKGNLRNAGGAFEGLKKQIQQLQGTGWKWGTPSAGAPTVLPGQGPVNWGQGGGQRPPQQGGPANWSPQPPQMPGAQPPQMPPMQQAPSMPPPVQAAPAQPSQVARQYAQAQALRPQQQRSALTPFSGG